MFEAYKVGVKLVLINEVTSGMTSIISWLRTGQTDADGLNKKLKEIRATLAAGAAIGGAGAFGLAMLGKTIKPASEYVHQLQLMNTAGMKHLEILKATDAAWAAGKDVPTSSASENLKAIRELRMVFRETSHAIEYMPVVQKMQGILGTLRGGHGGSGEAYEVAKALELKGAVKTPQQFVTQADLMTRAIMAGGGKIGATDFLGAFKYGRTATSGWDNDFTYKILPTLIQEMKASSGTSGGMGGPGNALMSAFSAIVGGSITQRALKVYQDLNLVDLSKAVWTKDGHLKGVHPGGIKGSNLFQTNPYEWVQTVLLPAMNAKGYTTDDQRRQAIQYLFPNRTAGFVMSQFATQAWKFEGDRKIIESAKGLESYQQLLKNDPVMAQMALAKQWESLLSIIGFQVMPELIKAMQVGISVTRSLAGWMERNHKTAKALVYTFGALSAVMAIGGTIISLTAAWRALQLVLPLVAGAGGSGGVALLIAKLAGKGGLIAAAGAAGYAIGTLANTLVDKAVVAATGGKNDTLGGWIWDKTHDAKGRFNPFGFDDSTYHAMMAGVGGAPAPYDTVRSSKQKAITVSTQLNVDGRKMASVVSKHQANELESAPKSGSMFDAMMAPLPVGW